MSTRISDNETIFIYDSVTGLPIMTESFDTPEQASAFLNWCEQESSQDIRTLTENQLEKYRAKFEGWYETASQSEKEKVLALSNYSSK